MQEFDLNNSLGYLIHIVNLKLRKRLDHGIKEFGLTSQQFGALLFISRAGPLTQKRIAQSAYKDEPAVTRIIAKLVEMGLVVREKNANDKREQLVSLTQEGEAVLNRMIPYAMETNQEAVDGISQSEYEMLLRLLNKINAAME